MVTGLFRITGVGDDVTTLLAEPLPHAHCANPLVAVNPAIAKLNIIDLNMFEPFRA